MILLSGDQTLPVHRPEYQRVALMRLQVEIRECPLVLEITAKTLSVIVG